MKRIKEIMLMIQILFLLGTLGCSTALKSSPNLEIIKTNVPFWLQYPDVYLTLRNKGGAGKTLITVTQQGSKPCKGIVYFDPGEQREVKLSCPVLGGEDNKEKKTLKYDLKPVDKASPEELQDASFP